MSRGKPGIGYTLNLHKLAGKKGMGIEEVAKAADMNPERVAHYWNGRMRAGKTALTQLAKAIGIKNPEDLLGDQPGSQVKQG